MSDSNVKVEIDLEDVQLLWDHVVSSMDWGSGFLDAEEMWRIIIIGYRLGFQVNDYLASILDSDSDYREWEKRNRPPSYWKPGFIYSAELSVREQNRNPNYESEKADWESMRLGFFESKLAKVLERYGFNEEN